MAEVPADFDVQMELSGTLGSHSREGVGDGLGLLMVRRDTEPHQTPWSGKWCEEVHLDTCGSGPETLFPGIACRWPGTDDRHTQWYCVDDTNRRTRCA